ncbi:MAG: hypothetical protein GF364_10040, partial [Candidatus Lokiarchaeota archaeon]|nr:hypothetical protein [Candidatus Lokiarchaeota archaeon]
GKKREMKGNEVITIAEDGTILSQFPYRDAKKTKVTRKTKNVFITCLGVDGITKNALKNAHSLVIDFLNKCELPKKAEFKATNPIYVSNFSPFQ